MDGQRRPERILELDGLRGIAIALVIAGHSWGTTRTPLLRRLAPWGEWGVDLGFVLSGLLVMGVLLDTAGSAGWRRHFFVRRALRVLPLYYLVLAIAWWGAPGWTGWRAEPGPAAGWPYLLLLQNFLGRAQDAGPLLVTWPLVIAQQCHVVWPLAVARLSRRGLVGLLAAALVLAPAARLVTFHFTGELPPVAYWTWNRLDGLIVGALLACAWRADGVSRERLRRWSAVCALGVPIALANRLWAGGGISLWLALYPSAAALGLGGVTGLVLASAMGGGRLAGVVRARLLRRVGRVSYGLYLWHPLVFAAHARIGFGDASAPPLAGDVMSLGTAYALLGVVAFASWHGFERPILAWHDRLAARPPAYPGWRSRPWHRHAGIGLAASAVAVATCFSVNHPATLTLDSGGIVFPLTLEAFRTWMGGSLPEWTDRIWGGFSLVGYPGTGALYLPHALGFLLTPGPAHLRAFDVTAALHMGLMTAGTSFLLVRLGAGTRGALVATILTTLAAAPLWSALAFFPAFLALAWWPWCFAAAEGIATSAPTSWPFLILGCVGLAAQMLVGYPAYGLYAGVFVGGWILLRRSALPLATRARRLLALVAGALAVAAPQLLPTLANLASAARAGPAAGGFVLPTHAPYAWSLFDPFADVGIPSPTFLGAATVALAAVGASTRRPGAMALLATAACSFALASANLVPLSAPLHGLPALRTLQVPMNLFISTELAICWLAGLGADRLAQLGGRRRTFAAILVVVAVAERGMYLTRWLPAMSASTAMTDVGAIVDDLARAPLLDHTRERPSARTVALPRAWGDILPIADVATVGGGTAGLLGRGPGFMAGMGRYRRDVLSLLGVRWVVAYPEDCDWQRHTLGFRAAATTPDLCVLENPHPGEHFVFLGHGSEVPTIDDMTARVLATPWAPPPIMAPDAQSVPPDRRAARGRIAIVADHAGAVTLATSSRAAGWLFVRETWSEGWAATIDGTPVTIHLAAGTFFALPVPQGQHEVVLSYHAPGLRAGLALAAAWGAMATFGLLRARRERTA